MEKVISDTRVPVKMWLNDIEEGALEQARNLANLPFAYKWVAVMPDAHQGYGMPIGGVLATEGQQLIPNAVGVDIGCGMAVQRTSLGEITPPDLKEIVSKIREHIPVGFNHHDTVQPDAYIPDIPTSGYYQIVRQEYEASFYQIGTLGGGNHFIELQLGTDGYVHIMIHSGSRNVGYKTAQHYNKLAQELNELYFSNTPKDLAFFPRGSKEWADYKSEMEFCIEFARMNREYMMDMVQAIIKDVVPNVVFDERLNKPHNFATIENHYGNNVMVHRKGACRARKGEYVMIPSSQGGYSYIVKGLGNPESFDSCSHGAGRVMSRTKAKDQLNLEEENRIIKEMGSMTTIRNQGSLDEAPSSYKDMDTVMGNQTDLVESITKLKPLATIKG